MSESDSDRDREDDDRAKKRLKLWHDKPLENPGPYSTLQRWKKKSREQFEEEGSDDTAEVSEVAPSASSFEGNPNEELNLFASHGESSPSYLNESELNDSGSELSVNNSGFEADNEHPAVNTIEGSQDLNLPASHGESDPPYSNESETNDLAPHAAESEFHTSNSEFESENEDLAPTNLEGSSNQDLNLSVLEDSKESESDDSESEISSNNLGFESDNEDRNRFDGFSPIPGEDDEEEDGEDGEGEEAEEEEEEEGEGEGEEEGEEEEGAQAGVEEQLDEQQEQQQQQQQQQAERERARRKAERLGGARLYPNSAITVLQAVYLVIRLFFKHKFTKSLLSDILQLLQELLPARNRMPRSLYLLFKFVEAFGPDARVVVHYMCVKKNCKTYVGVNKSRKCVKCNQNDTLEGFYEFDVEDQIRHLFEARNLAEQLDKERNPEVISDIFTGSEYQRVNENRQPYDVTLMLNTDGISLSKSSKSHCWPIFATIAEVPAKLRRSFLIVIGLWCSKFKPALNSLFLPFVTTINRCNAQGVRWEHPENKTPNISKVYAPIVIADAPARAEVENILGHAGAFGCNWCEIETVRYRRGGKSYRIYPFMRIQDLQMRTEIKMLDQADEAVERNLKHVKGVKGLSIAATLPGADWSTMTPPELMHSMLLGVGGTMLELQFGKKAPVALKRQMNKIDRDLMDIRVPSTFPRYPRSLNERGSYKATEHLFYILHYSIPLMYKHFPEHYLQHYMALSYGLFLLLQQKVTEDDIKKAEVLLENFAEHLHTLYDLQGCTYNMHQVLHMGIYTTRWGSLWATAMFLFENENGVISNTSHATKNIKQELVNNIKLLRAFQVLKGKVDMDAFPEFQQNRALGKSVSIENILSRAEHQFFIENVDEPIDEMKFHYRYRINGVVYASSKHKNSKSNDYSVHVVLNNGLKIFGDILAFFDFNGEVGFLLERIEIDAENIFYHASTDIIVDHILPIAQPGRNKEFVIIKMADSRELSHVIKAGNFLCLQPNSLNLSF